MRIALRILAFWLICGAVALAAQSAATPAPKTSHPPSNDATPPRGSVARNAYRNPFFDTVFKFPYGWVQRTDRMAEAAKEDAKGTVLLAVFERPPEAAGGGVNSAVLIAAESVTAYPTVTTVSDYFGPLESGRRRQGFLGDRRGYKFYVGSRLMGRVDFEKATPPVARQSTLVIIEKGYIVSFTFIAETEDEIKELIEGLSLEPPRGAPAAHPGKPAK